MLLNYRADGRSEAGFLGLNAGLLTPLFLLAAHAVWGLVSAATYEEFEE